MPKHQQNTKYILNIKSIVYHVLIMYDQRLSCITGRPDAVHEADIFESTI